MKKPTIEEENRLLKNRCSVLTRGMLCYWCPIDCESRQHDYNPDYVPENKDEE